MNARAKGQDQRELTKHDLMRLVDRLRGTVADQRKTIARAIVAHAKMYNEMADAREHPWRWAWKQWRTRG